MSTRIKQSHTEDNKPKRAGKTNGYKSDTLWAKRDQRRADAEERQLHWAGLTPKQQLAKLATRPGKSERQTARIQAEIDAEKEATRAKADSKVGEVVRSAKRVKV